MTDDAMALLAGGYPLLDITEYKNTERESVRLLRMSRPTEQKTNE